MTSKMMSWFMVKSEWISPRAGGNPSKNTIVPPWRDMQSRGKPLDIFGEIIPERDRNVKG
jgi:hypothetical protein